MIDSSRHPVRRAIGTLRLVVVAASLLSMTACMRSEASLDDPTRDALLKAIDDERQAQHFYRSVVAQHGEIPPFVEVVGAEARHEAELVAICRQKGISIPHFATSPELELPESVREACEAAVEAERRSIAMYDELIERATDETVRSTFSRLRAASQDRHLPAFARCVNNSSDFARPVASAGNCGSCNMPGCGCGSAQEPARPAGCGCAAARRQAAAQ